MMELELLDESDDGNKVMMHVKETTPHYMNTLRRLLMNEVPVLAIETVEFKQNSSILYDEILAHRMGMLAIKTDLTSFNLPSECKCDGEGCAECELKMTLKAEADEDGTLVYAKEIKSKDKKAVPIHEDTPLVMLDEGQAVECEMTAVLGRGKEHSKWSPCLSWFKYYPHVEIEEQPDNAEDIAEEYPTIFEMDDDELVLNEENLLRQDVIDESIEEETDGAIKYEEKDDFVLFIESWGQIGVEDLMEKAIDVHEEQIKEFDKLLKDV